MRKPRLESGANSWRANSESAIGQHDVFEFFERCCIVVGGPKTRSCHITRSSLSLIFFVHRFFLIAAHVTRENAFWPPTPIRSIWWNFALSRLLVRSKPRERCLSVSRTQCNIRIQADKVYFRGLPELSWLCKLRYQDRPLFAPSLGNISLFTLHHCPSLPLPLPITNQEGRRREEVFAEYMNVPTGRPTKIVGLTFQYSPPTISPHGCVMHHTLFPCTD